MKLMLLLSRLIQFLSCIIFKLINIMYIILKEDEPTEVEKYDEKKQAEVQQLKDIKVFPSYLT